MAHEVFWLGYKAREIASALRKAMPMSEADAVNIVRVGPTDCGLAAGILARLVEYEIAKPVEGGFIRGPAWPRNRQHYGWSNR